MPGLRNTGKAREANEIINIGEERNRGSDEGNERVGLGGGRGTDLINTRGDGKIKGRFVERMRFMFEEGSER